MEKRCRACGEDKVVQSAGGDSSRHLLEQAATTHNGRNGSGSDGVLKVPVKYGQQEAILVQNP